MAQGTSENTTVPIPVIRRLSHYLQHIRVEPEEQGEWISSLELARALDVTSSTVRQDLSYLDIRGTAKRGYKTREFESCILTLLGRDQVTRMVIVGAGNLGRALALHEEFPRQGFAAVGLFDTDPDLIGAPIGELDVQSVDELPRVVEEKEVEIGVIAVPTKTAQEVADLLVDAGVKGVLNMSTAHVRTTAEVALVEARMYSSLSLLSYAIKARKGANVEKGG